MHTTVLCVTCKAQALEHGTIVHVLLFKISARGGGGGGEGQSPCSAPSVYDNVTICDVQRCSGFLQCVMPYTVQCLHIKTVMPRCKHKRRLLTSTDFQGHHQGGWGE